MADQKTAEETLARLRELVANARSMPMSASCVVNRRDVLAAIDDVIHHLPDEIAEAQEVIENSRDAMAAGEAEAERITDEARTRAATLATDTEVIKVAEGKAAEIIAKAEADAAALRQEADAFVDSRMASFESVLARTSSQVRTARARLAERSKLDRPHGESAQSEAAATAASAGAGTTADLGITAS
jgi:cell division septum initiation protein DivIVA